MLAMGVEGAEGGNASRELTTWFGMELLEA